MKFSTLFQQRDDTHGYSAATPQWHTCMMLLCISCTRARPGVLLGVRARVRSGAGKVGHAGTTADGWPACNVQCAVTSDHWPHHIGRARYGSLTRHHHVFKTRCDCVNVLFSGTRPITRRNAYAIRRHDGGRRGPGLDPQSQRPTTLLRCPCTTTRSKVTTGFLFPGEFPCRRSHWREPCRSATNDAGAFSNRVHLRACNTSQRDVITFFVLREQCIFENIPTKKKKKTIHPAACAHPYRRAAQCTETLEQTSNFHKHRSYADNGYHRGEKLISFFIHYFIINRFYAGPVPVLKKKPDWRPSRSHIFSIKMPRWV